ncbi:MAG: hypothetical protein HFJ75_09405 [Eggerthellaceae bacterium]|nr:hypothetical protein [Eggerthellaceae bacterium]
MHLLTDKATVYLAAIIGALLIGSSIAGSLWMKEATTHTALNQERPVDDSALSNTGTNEQSASEQSAPALDGDALDPELCYKTRFFTLEVPSSWRNRWDVKETTSTRESMLQIAGYHYTIRLDNVEAFTLSAQIANINADLVIGWSNGYAVHFWVSGEISEEDLAYVREHLKLEPNDPATTGPNRAY